MSTLEDLDRAAAIILEKITCGKLSLEEGREMSHLVATRHRILVARELGRQLSGGNSDGSVDLKRLGSKSVVVFEEPFQDLTVYNAVCELLGTGASQKAATARPSP